MECVEDRLDGVDRQLGRFDGDRASHRMLACFRDGVASTAVALLCLGTVCWSTAFFLWSCNAGAGRGTVGSLSGVGTLQPWRELG